MTDERLGTFVCWCGKTGALPVAEHVTYVCGCGREYSMRINTETIMRRIDEFERREAERAAATQETER